MKHLEKVREALAIFGRLAMVGTSVNDNESCPVVFTMKEIREKSKALSALQAHEEEVRLLLQAARDIAEHNMTYFGEDAATSDPASLWSKVRFLRSALRPFTGDEK